MGTQYDELRNQNSRVSKADIKNTVVIKLSEPQNMVNILYFPMEWSNIPNFII